MIPNPVQRRGNAAPMPTDSMIEPCAQEGGTFRDPVPTRPAAPIAEYGLPTWACGLIVLATCGFCMWLGA